MQIPIVNRQDEIIDYKERNKISNEDIKRITHVWVLNKNKDFLIARRHPSKAVSPDKWSHAVIGTVERGETYESNALKEIEEEIGVKYAGLIPLKKIFYENSNGRRFCYIYIAYVDKPAEEFKLQEDEVTEVRWITLGELSKWYQRSPDDFIPSMGNTIKLAKEFLNS